jgi:hypothetical protein
MAERTVIYRIKVINDPKNAAESAKLAKSVVDAEKKMHADRTAASAKANTTMARDAERAAREKAKADKEAARQAIQATREKEKAERQAASAAKAAAREQERAAKQAAMVAKQSAREQENAAKAVAREASRAAAEQQRAAAAVSNEQARLTSIVTASGKQIHSSFKEMAGGTLTMARGVAELGLLGEESTEKLVRGLIAVQGSFDVLIGGLDTYYGLVEMTEKYRIAQEAAGRAVQLQAAANTTAVRAEAVATQQLAVARTMANAAAGGGGAAGIVAGAGGSAVGGLSGRIAGGVNRLGGAIGGAVMGGAGAAAGKVGATGVGAGAVGTIGAAAAAIAGAGFGIASALATAREAINNGVGGGAAAGSFVESVGGSNYNPFSWMVAWSAKWEQSAKEALTAQREQELELVKLQRDRNRAFADVDLAESLQIMQQAVTNVQAGLGADTGAQAEALARQREIMQGARGGILAQAGSDASRNEAGLAIAQMEMNNIREEFELRKRIKEERVQAAQESLDLSKQELATVQQQLAVDQERLTSAKERFGQLNELEQQRLIAIKQRADAQGFSSLSREERGMLRSVGTDDATQIAAQGDIAAADAAGFDAVFGQTQRENIRRQGELKQRLETEINVKQDLVVKVETDNEAILDRVREEFAKNQNLLVPLIQQVAIEEAAKARDKIIAEFDARQRGLPFAGGRR